MPPPPSPKNKVAIVCTDDGGPNSALSVEILKGDETSAAGRLAAFALAAIVAGTQNISLLTPEAKALISLHQGMALEEEQAAAAAGEADETLFQETAK